MAVRPDDLAAGSETPTEEPGESGSRPVGSFERLRGGFDGLRSGITGREVLVSGVIGIVAWPIASAGAGTGIDPSWIVALHLAARRGLLFGHDIVFTYGPLGYLGWPDPYIAWTSAAALVFVAAIHFIACLTLVHLARQSFGLPKATLFVFVTAFTFPWIAGWRLYGILLFIAAATALYRRAERPTGTRFAIAIGIAVGVAGLGKLNVAIVGLVVAAIGVGATARQPLRSLAAFGGAVAVAFLALWLATGQHLTDVLVYGQTAIDLSVGYSQSMGAVDPQTEWTSGVALLATLVLIAMFWKRTSTLPLRDRVALTVLIAMTVVAEYKAGFTRAGVGVTIYLATLLAIWPLVAPKTRSWAVASMPVAGMLAALIAISALPITKLVDPAGRTGALKTQVATALFQRGDAARATAASLRAQYALPSEAIDLLVGRTVHIEPWEAAVAEAYPEMEWAPLPVFQAYSAYTPALDRLNADRLASPEAPDAILWVTPPGQPLSIDGRGLWFDAPLAKIEMLCRYVPVVVKDSWQVLVRRTNRCGAPIDVATVNGVSGSSTAMPAGLPAGIVTISIGGVASDILSRVQIALDHGAPWFVSDGKTDQRIPLGTAMEPNVIGSNVDTGYRGALSLFSPPANLTIGPRPGDFGAGTSLTIRVSVIPLLAAP